MEIISFFDSPDREYWLSKLRQCDWRAGAFLCELIDGDKFFETLGNTSKLLLLTDGDRLVSFCTLSARDEIQDTELTPWIGFVYTFPEYRGHRCFGRLLNEAKRLAAEAGFEKIYLSTDHIGLYEKYGFEFAGTAVTVYGDRTRYYTAGTE
ncbi:MAG: GNAT family N-acetyltransferase [Ruminococcus sp.]|nr:GNAT family N-acetyltransferase [Ruminococcus sp.]